MVLRHSKSLPFVVALFTLVSCTKIDTTRLGNDLIPVVDNVNTFDTVLNVITNNFIFQDSTRMLRSDQHAVGNIKNDPLFGSTTAAIFMEMKPTSYPTFFFAKDSLVGLDSIVLSLSLKATYGDTSGTPINFKVYQIAQTANFKYDTTNSGNYKISESFDRGALLGQRSYAAVRNIKDTVPIMRGTTLKYKAVNQIRIALSGADLEQLFRDTAKWANDSAIVSKFKGFKIEADVPGSPGALCYFSLTDTASKLEFFYRRKIGVIDTTSVAYYCGVNSAHLNNVVSDRTGSEINDHLTVRPAGDSLIYLQTTPGSYAKLDIPGLSSMSNRIIHRAELTITEVPDNSMASNFLKRPNYLYLERFDTASDRNKMQPIPFDLNPNSNYGNCFPTNDGIDYGYFGGLPKLSVVNGVVANVYTFNLSRYVQSIVTRKTFNKSLRLSPEIFTQYFDCFGTDYINVTGNRVGEGRVRVGGGTHSKFRMRMRVIYSKI